LIQDESVALLNALCRLVGLVTVTLADSGILPLQLQRTVDELIDVIDELITSIGSLMPNATIGNVMCQLKLLFCFDCCQNEFI
jgi:hypothetical protein